jgi:hypothetical protein
LGNRLIGIGRPEILAAQAGGPWAVSSRAGRVNGISYLPCRAPRAQNRPWAAKGHGPNIFFIIIFSPSQFYCFLFSFLSKFQIFFSIQIIPTKNLFREFKSYRNISKKFKVNEF